MSIVEILKQNFYDCTYGGEDEHFIMYDIGLDEYFAHVNIHKEKKEIFVKVFDPEDDSEPINNDNFRNVQGVISFLQLSLWRHVWDKRQKINRSDSKEKLIAWVHNHQHEYDETIHIDKHPKDEWVAYYLLPKTNK